MGVWVGSKCTSSQKTDSEGALLPDAPSPLYPSPQVGMQWPRGQLDLSIALQEHMIKAGRDAVPSIPGWGQVMGENRISREQNGGRERWALLLG